MSLNVKYFVGWLKDDLIASPIYRENLRVKIEEHETNGRELVMFAIPKEKLQADPEAVTFIENYLQERFGK